MKPNLKRRFSTYTHSVDHIVENWTVLENFFRVAAFEDKLKNGESINSEFNKWFTKAYMLFLNYALNYFNEFKSLIKQGSL